MNQPKVQLLITMDGTGGVGVQGPIADKVLCYGLLECARDAIKDFGDKLARDRAGISIVPASAVPDISKDRHISFDAPLNGKP